MITCSDMSTQRTTNQKEHVTMTFTVSRLTGSRALVQGTDNLGTEGKVVISTAQWDEVNADKAYSQAEDAFESAVDSFFAPLLAAAEKMAEAQKTGNRPDDPSAYVVLEEPTEGVAAKPGRLVKLNKDSIVLRLIEQGDTSRLVWVNDSLEILEVLPATAPVAQPVGTDEV